ncbi:MAG: GntR family transcriptional regulator [Desulfovibrio sp.]|nr:GntR family transcriptional regulator [Desulfovibrio sp.]
MFERKDDNFSLDDEMFQKTGVPLYLQAAAFIRRLIESGEWPIGFRLPSLENLARFFGMSRVTVRQAVQSLVTENLLESCQGRGTFVASKPDPRQRVRLLTSWQALIRRVENYKVEIITEADVDSCPPLRGRPGKCYPKYHYMKRLHLRNNKPFVLLDVYLEREIFQRAPDKVLSMPVLAALGDLKIEVSKANQVMTIGAADTEASHFLHIPQAAPVAYVVRIAEDKFGKVFYVANLTYPGDQIYQEVDMLI